MNCRLLPHIVADGPHQMGLDEALLDSVADRPESAVVRTYAWSVPTLSLGYFQRISEALEEERWREVPIVRRLTGGGAIWHHHELTYALILPRHHPRAVRPSELYRVVHAALAGLLVEAGAPARRRGESGEENADRPFLCFTDRDPEDIVIGRWKVVGSAQRRRRRAVLLHGSILLARSERAPEMPGLGEAAEFDANPPDWADRIQVRLPDALGLDVVRDEPSRGERMRALTLAGEVYANPTWTNRR